MARNPNWSEDEVVLVIDLLQRTQGKVPDTTHRELVALSKKLQALPIHPMEKRQKDFRSPNSVRLKCFNLLANEPGLYEAKNLVATNQELWARYWKSPSATATRIASIYSAADELGAAPSATDDDEAVEEGSIVLKAHKTRERRKDLRKKVIAQCLKQHGEVMCTGCGISETCYATTSEVSRKIFEAHHTQPLGKAATPTITTKVSDVVLLCANCHRLIHALMAQHGRVVTVEELSIVQARLNNSGKLLSCPLADSASDAE